jgi:hypothetical protein
MMPKTEIEGFGVTYDRYILARMQRRLVDERSLKRVVEMPTKGAKAAGSLYSVGFAMAGCEVHLVNPDPYVSELWTSIGISDKARLADSIDIYSTPYEDDYFDLAWNFVTFANVEDHTGYMEEMKRISSQYVLVVSCNALQIGYPWHRVIHKTLGFPWNHGDTKYWFIWNVKKLFQKVGLRIAEYGTIDSPPWPDPVGFRDIRLHKIGAKELNSRWEVPFVEYVVNDRFPWWMKVLGLYDLPLRKGYWKLPFSHLFYVLGEKRCDG